MGQRLVAAGLQLILYQGAMVFLGVVSGLDVAFQSLNVIVRYYRHF